MAVRERTGTGWRPMEWVSCNFIFRGESRLFLMSMVLFLTGTPVFGSVRDNLVGDTLCVET